MKKIIFIAIILLLPSGVLAGSGQAHKEAVHARNAIKAANIKIERNLVVLDKGAGAVLQDLINLLHSTGKIDKAALSQDSQEWLTERAELKNELQ